MIGIIGAMEAEVALLRAAMEGGRVEAAGPFEFVVGTLEGRDAALLRCGIGKVNAAVGCALLLRDYRPGLVINTGSAGGVDPSLRVGDLVVSTGLVYHDVDVTGFGYPPGQIPGQPLVFGTPEPLMRLAEEAVDGLLRDGTLPAGLRRARGIIGSGDVFMNDPARIAEARRRFPGLLAVEMEGAAIAHACALFGVPALVIRAVSDVAGVESAQTFEEFLPLASRHSAALVRRLVKAGAGG